MAIADYIQIARPSHWFKNIFIVPGILLAFYFEPETAAQTPWLQIAAGIIATCLVASANYVLNEILDAPADKHHPDKAARPIPSGRVSLPFAYAEWILLTLAGLGLAALFGKGLFFSCASLWIMGLIYNIPPVRSKDLPYLDVLSESINNPIRMAIGWYSAGVAQLPTLSVLLAYWMFGAFLMAVKRFAELRRIADGVHAARYRKSFSFYNEERLLVSILFYVALFGMFSGVFIARYRVELVLATPFVAFALASYFRIGFKPNSPAMKPEDLWRYKSILVPTSIAFAACGFLLFFDLAEMRTWFAPAFQMRALP